MMTSLGQVRPRLLAVGRRLSTSATGRAVFRSHADDIQPANKTVFEMIWERRQRWANQPAFICGVTDKTLSFAETYRNVLRLSESLHRRGYRQGDVVAAVLPNCLEMPTLVHACAARGIITTTMNPLYKEEDMVRQLELSGARAVVAHPSLLETVRAAAARVPTVTEVACTGGDALPAGVLSFEELLRTGREETPSVDVDLQKDPLLLLFSSGTTGLPKAVALTNYNVGSNLLQTTHEEFAWEKLGKERFIGMLPMFHLFGLFINILKGPFVGASSIILPHFEPKLFLDTLKRYKPTHLHVVPPLITFMANSPDVDKTVLNSVEVIFCAAAPLGKQLQMRFCEKTKSSFELIQGFGMTETSPVVTLGSNTKRGDHPGTCGVLVPSTEVKMLAVDDGRELEQDEIGELCVRGPQVMLGYYNNPEATAATVDSDGWLHTGDVGYCNEDGFFFIVDRVKELIKYKGFQVAPASLEDLLRKHDGVLDAAVIGVPDEEAGELPRAYVVTRDGDVSAQQVADFVNSQVNVHSKLRGGVRIVQAIPKSDTGKILRRELREMAEREIAEAQSADSATRDQRDRD